MLPFSPPIVKRLSSLQKGTPKNEAEEKWSEKAIKVRKLALDVKADFFRLSNTGLPICLVKTSR